PPPSFPCRRRRFLAARWREAQVREHRFWRNTKGLPSRPPDRVVVAAPAALAAWIRGRRIRQTQFDRVVLSK
ncbi:MAG: hypothetical protein J2P37_33260, partial [Ktedonobacteraceae bacterium]|nr:hypothetical protein [Ktedonobacteraceae bacterium]